MSVRRPNPPEIVEIFARALRAQELSPTFGRRAPNFREISRALRAPNFLKNFRESLTRA